MAAALTPAAGQATSAGRRTAWDGVYTTAQAERASAVYRDQCANCHAQNMRGAPGAPGLAGPGFMFEWNGKSAGELFDVLKKTMPPGGAGRLTDQQYADLVAAMLHANGFPAGTTDLPATRTALDSILITRQKGS
jgi:mono/diheme cytochrome c family protein